MKTFFIPLLALLLLALPPSAGATLCAQCNGMVFTADIGQCKVCVDGITTSGAFKLCKKCSTKLAQCEACQEDLKPKTEPPPAFEAPPAKPKAYPVHWGAPPRIQTRWIQKNLDQDAKASPEPEKKKPDTAEEIRQIEKKIAEMEEFATRARFTPEGMKKHQAELAALRARLKELKGETKPQ